MLPTVFLSLSGSDQEFVGEVQRNLPDGLAYYYPKSFQNGENLIQAMEERVESASVFALFASRRSIDSVWVNFEIDRARIEKIKNKEFRVLVFPVESGLTSRDLPEWMQAYWIASAGHSPRDVSRYLRNLLTNSLFSSLHSSQVFGRGALIDQACGSYLSATAMNKVKPNIIVFGGHEGIGRRTLAREILKRVFPALPEISYGPEFSLSQFADLEDIYRSLRQEISGGLTIEAMSQENAAFQNLNQNEKISEVCRCLKYFGDLGQSVKIVSGNGMFEDRGTLKSWVPDLFLEISNAPEIKVCIISNRLIHDNEARPHLNLAQIAVGHISDSDVKSLMIAAISDFGVDPVMPNDLVISGIGGHPQIAKIAARIVAAQGAAVLEHDPKKLYDIQEEILGYSVDLEVLSVNEKKILSILSWVPQLSSDLLAEVIVEKEGLAGEEFSDCLSNLERSCLIQSIGSNYCIASPIRLLFRRKYGYGSKELRASFSSVLKSTWDKATEGEQVRTDLVDAILFMASIEGGTLDPAFQGLLLPSSFQSVIRAAYDSRHHDDQALSRVVSWGAPAKTMKMDEATREEILSYVVRALSRLGEREQASDLLEFIDKKLYRSRHYLRSFYVRHCGGKLEDAVKELEQAYKVKKYMQSVVADLALCYQKLGAWDRLLGLIDREGDRIENNAGLLDVKAGFQISRKQFSEAEATIRKLSNHPFGDGRATSRTAMIMMHRDQNYSGAKELLTISLQGGGVSMVPTRRLRAIAAAYDNDRNMVEKDIAFLKTKPDGADTSSRILARLLLTEGDPVAAQNEIAKVKRLTHQDELLRAKILDAIAGDIKTPLIERKALQEEIRAIRSKHSIVSEYEASV